MSTESFVEDNGRKAGISAEDMNLLMNWFAENKDHKMNFLEKEAIKLAVRKADTVGDLLQTALGLLKK